ncbi:MAG: hypothetical protein RLZZ01_2153 [Actinomycetota bacterium]
MTIVLIAIGVAVVAVAAYVVSTRRRTDGVDSFRRQIDALSAESRRTTVDQVQDAARRRGQRTDRREPDGDEGGVRGS